MTLQIVDLLRIEYLSYCLRRKNKSSSLSIPISHSPWESGEFPPRDFGMAVYIRSEAEPNCLSVIIFVPDEDGDDYHSLGSHGLGRNHHTETRPALWSIQEKDGD